MKKRSIVESAMRYRGIAFFICALLMFFGIFSLSNIRKNEFPNFTVRQGVVVAAFPGANVEEVEARVTKPLEEYIFTYGEVQKKKTTSTTLDGMAIIQVQLEDNVQDKDAFWSKFKHGVNNFKSSLPAGVLAIVVMDDFGDASAILLSLESENKTYGELNDYLDSLTDRLRTIESVGRINRFGNQKEQVSIYLDNEKLSHYGLGFKSTALMLAGQGLMNISGNLKDENFTRPIYVESKVNSLQDVQETVIFSAPDGSVVRLKDVARVVREYPERTSYIEQNGNKTLILSIEMKSGCNIVQMGHDVDKVLKEFEQKLPSEVKMARITDQPQVVEKSVEDFLKELLIAIISVIVVVMLLQPFRVSLIAAATIPITIFISLGFFYVFNFELNTVTLAALIVTLGMIVDNSIVILDDYQERIAAGEERWRAAEKSASHFVKSIFSATLAISITFFPLLFTMRGMFQDFLQTFPWAITIVLMVSLLVAILIVPYLQFAFLKKTPKKSHRFSFERVTGFVHEKVLRACFKFPKTTVFLAIVVTAIGGYILATTPIRLLPIAQRNQFSVEITLPSGTSLQQTSTVADSLEKMLEVDDRITSITSFKGLSSPRFHLTYAPQFGGTNFAQFIVNTNSVESTDKIISEYSEKYASHFAGAEVRFKQLSYSDAVAPVEYYISGGSDESLKKANQEVLQYMRNVPEFYLVRSSLKDPLNGVSVTLKEDAAKLGINRTEAEILLAARYGSGIPVASLWEGNKNVPVVLKSTNSDSADYAALANEKFPTFGGMGNVPLRQIADIKPVYHSGALYRRNGIPTVTAMAEVANGVNYNNIAHKHLDNIQTIVNRISAESGESMKVELGGEAAVVSEQLPRIISALVFAVAIILFILIWHFRKISTAIMLLCSLGLCLLGTGMSLFLSGIDFGVTCVLGIISLLGIMVRNGIIMIDYAEELKHKEHYDAKTAIFNSALRRMRPIFLTSAAASVGVIPMILGGSSLWMPMGVVIFVGTLITMVLILTVLPVVYWGVSSIKFRRRKKSVVCILKSEVVK